jgi:glycosyltransferase involved in cell wall biosynthesis
MRIGFDAKRIYHNTTGLGNYGRDLVRVLADFNPMNRYFLYNTRAKKVDRLVNNEALLEKLPRTAFWRFFSSIWRQGPIVNQLIKNEVHVFHGLSGELPSGIEKTGIKSVVTIHDLIFIRYPKLYSFFDQKIHVLKVKRAVKRADRIIAISEQTKRDIVDFLQVDEKNIDVIYQGCHQVFKEKATQKFKSEVLLKYHLPSEFILNVGTINERKNVLSLLKAIKDLNISLVIVGGKTSYYQEIEKYIKQHHLQSRIFVIQGLTLKELSALYQQASLFVYPSVFEGFGIPIIEALYSKTPVITSLGGCFPEAGGPNSIYVEVNNIKELTIQIIAVLSNHELRKTMIEKGYEFVHKFNDQAMAKSYMNVYNSLF